MKIGINSIDFYTSKYKISHQKLAIANNLKDSYYEEKIWQKFMSVPSKTDNIISMSIESTKRLIDVDPFLREKVDLIIFCTESTLDFSKAMGIFVHKELKFKPECRIIEMKQACYSSTVALQLAYSHIKCNSKSHVLIIASDIAYYGIGNIGEETQGCGAIAMTISKNPKIAKISKKSIFLTEESNDFYRPIDSKIPIFNGLKSTKKYLQMLKKCYNCYISKYGNTKIEYLCCHLPFAKIYQDACKIVNGNFISGLPSIKYTTEVGNIYSASLLLSFLSLLDNSNENLSKKRIYMYAYGSGSSAELFSIKICKKYKIFLNKSNRDLLFSQQENIDYNTYLSYIS